MTSRIIRDPGAKDPPGWEKTPRAARWPIATNWWTGVLGIESPTAKQVPLKEAVVIERCPHPQKVLLHPNPQNLWMGPSLGKEHLQMEVRISR